MSESKKRVDCKKCGKRIDGSHSTWCCSCYAEWKRSRYAANREKEIARVLEYNRKNPEKFKATLKRYRQGDSYKKSRKAWEVANPEKVELYATKHHATRRSAIRATVDKITTTQWREIKEKYRHCCSYCGKRSKRLTMDHVVPLAKGGDHSVGNIVPACLCCNMKKNALEQMVFYQSLGLLL